MCSTRTPRADESESAKGHLTYYVKERTLAMKFMLLRLCYRSHRNVGQEFKAPFRQPCGESEIPALRFQ
eukprot:281719-Amphidinium_carterae.1